MTNLSWLPYPGSPTQWFSQRWPQTTTNGASQPALLLQPVGTTPGTWSTSGTGLGINAPATFAGNLLDLQVGGASRSTIRSDGRTTINTVVVGSALSLNYLDSNGAISSNTAFYNANNGCAISLNARLVMQANTTQYGSGLGIKLANVDSYMWTDGLATNNPDLFLYRDAANTLAQRNGTNAQTFRVYNTYTSTTNYERAKLEWSSNALKVGTEKGSGGGTARPMSLQTDATDRLTITAVGTAVINTDFTVATLPGTPTTGEIARVTDASAPAMGSTVVGGGAAFALVVYNGANWRVFAI